MPGHAQCFRTKEEWLLCEPPGQFTSGSSFKPGTFSRCIEQTAGHRFLVVESDTLSRDDVGSIFLWLNVRLRYRMHAIIDTAGKSLHGWFSFPRDAIAEKRLKAALVVLGCDPKMFTASQPVRAPGAMRDGKLQRLIWIE
jgi:hypothetical protein